MTIPKDVLRFEVLLYLTLLLDTLTAAVYGAAPENAGEATQATFNLVAAGLLAGLAILVWLAARRQKNWARWTLLAWFALMLVTYAGTLNQVTFGLRMVIDIASLALSVAGFFFAFTTQARQWFKS
jgi:hypothetical protein